MREEHNVPQDFYITVSGGSNVTFTLPTYDEETLAALRQAELDQSETLKQLEESYEKAAKALREKRDELDTQLNTLTSLHRENKMRVFDAYNDAKRAITGEGENS